MHACAADQKTLTEITVRHGKFVLPDHFEVFQNNPTIDKICDGKLKIK